MHCRHKYDCGCLAARMFPDQGCKFEAIELRHADVNENNGDVMFKKLAKGFVGRGGLEQILTKVLKDNLVAQQLGWLVVDRRILTLSGAIIASRS